MMHDPMTVAFTIRYPWRKYGRRAKTAFDREYREPFITIWHVDPETDGSDDSCGWFMRAKHGDKTTLDRIIKRFESDWDRVFISEETSRQYLCGLFAPSGKPHLSPLGITLNLFFLAAIEHLGSRDRAMRWLSRNMAEIALFAENTTDSLFDKITQKFGDDGRREERVRGFAVIVYGWLLRESRPWYRHPRWHLWHWQLQVHPWQNLRRFMLTRCEGCGRMFAYGEAPTASSWDRDEPKFLRGERGLYHSRCMNGRGGRDGAQVT